MNIRRALPIRLVPAVLCAILMVSALSSCASFPEPGSPEDTLLYIPVETNELSGQTVFGFLRLSVQDQATGKPVKNIDVYANKDGKLVSGLKPGDYVVENIAFNYKDGGAGKSYKPNIRFTLKPGTITIFPFLVQLSATRASETSSTIWMSYRWDPLKAEQKKAAIDRLAENEAFALWQTK